MSWIFVSLGKNQNKLNEFENIHDVPLYQYHNDSLYIAAGGYMQTCTAGRNNNINEGFVIAGLGIPASNQKGFLGSDEWSIVLTKEFNPLNQDGHFLIVNWDNDNIKIFTDVLGVRDIYLYKDPNRIILSSKAEWLLGFTKPEINFEVFASRWLMYNQISTDCIFKNITRYLSGQTVQINRHDLTIKETKTEFLPDIQSRYNEVDYDEKLTDLTLLPLKFAGLNSISESHASKLSLSVSGGMDSRVLLSILAGSGLTNWDLHTFGPKDHPDRKIAERIASDLSIPHTLIDLPLPDTGILINDLSEYVKFTLASNPASDIVQLMNYKNLTGKYETIIDGGFGGIWRRSLLNRLYFVGKKGLQNLDPHKIFKYLKIQSGNIFSNEINDIMNAGCIEQIDSFVHQLPKISDIGLENWLDLFGIRTRLPNMYANEQVRLDNYFTCYMPYLQPSLLKMLFSIDVNKRKNAGLFKYIINKHQKVLSKYPLAKDNSICPYYLTSMQSKLYVRIMKKAGMSYHDNRKTAFFNKLRDFILDSINSRNFKEYPHYNHDYIRHIINKYYKGDKSSEYELDRFLSYEILRQITNIQ